MQAGLSLCWSHIPHCCKSHVVAHIWTSLLLFREMLRPGITDLFCFGAKSTGVDLYSQTKFYLQASRSCQSLHFQRKRELTFLCLCAFLWHENKKEWNKKSCVDQDSNPQYAYLELCWLTTPRLPWKVQLHWVTNGSHQKFFSVNARNIPIAHDPSRKTIYSVLIP